MKRKGSTINEVLIGIVDIVGLIVANRSYTIGSEEDKKKIEDAMILHLHKFKRTPL